MNIEQNEILQRFCNILEDEEIICSQCADALRTSTDLIFIDVSNLNRMKNVVLHVGCTVNLLRSFRSNIF